MELLSRLPAASPARELFRGAVPPACAAGALFAAPAEIDESR
jgi:hypothetical protein